MYLKWFAIFLFHIQWFGRSIVNRFFHFKQKLDKSFIAGPQFFGRNQRVVAQIKRFDGMNKIVLSFMNFKLKFSGAFGYLG